MFPGRFRRRKSDSLGPRPASVSSLRARVHTHVDAQHEAGHLTQAASAEQINRRTDTARVSERPRPGGNAGQYMQAENSSQDVPLQGVVLFCQPISLAKQNHPLGVLRSGPDRPVRICEDRLQVQESRSPRVSPSRSPRRLRNRSSSSSSVYEVSVCEEGEEWPEGRVLPVRGYGARPRTGRHVSGFKSGCGGAARGRAGGVIPGVLIRVRF